MDFNLSSTQLFYRLIDKNASERDLILSDVRQNSPQLARNVDELLKHANNDFAINALEVHLSTANESTVCYENLRVDRYVIGHELGRGGFAAVYYAARYDSLFHHQYAIKFFHPEILGLLGQEALFSEAQLLANVSHSNIAKVYDAGIYNGASLYRDGVCRWVELTRLLKLTVVEFRSEVDAVSRYLLGCRSCSSTSGYSWRS